MDRDMLLLQVCSDPTPMLCSTGFGKVCSPMYSAALQNRLTAGSVSLQLHLWRIAVHTAVQWPNSIALLLWFWQNEFPTVQCCSAKQTHSMLVSLQLHPWRSAINTAVH